ncbi:MAG: glycosyltransferase family 2 protein [Rhodoferax sp.]|nr:glycosyltransferase family 2 protein [Rhodoferax sp.]
MIDIICVNWNAGDQLHACIASIAQYGSGLVFQTIVIDNGSIDGSDACVEGLPNVKLIRTGANLGFGKACNLGAQQAKSEYLLFLNPDAALYAGTLPKALTYMQDPVHANVGVCGVQLLDEAGHVSRSCSRFPSTADFAAHALGLDRFFPRLGHFMAEWDHAQTRQVDHVIGAFFLVRRALFESLHGFDERFFVYLEDLDFSFRARQAGWRSMYLADARAFHAGGGTSSQVKAHRLFYSLRSRLLYGFKHFTPWQAWTLVGLTLVVELITRTVFSLLRGGVRDVRNTFKAYGMLMRDLPRILGLRRAV